MQTRATTTDPADGQNKTLSPLDQEEAAALVEHAVRLSEAGRTDTAIGLFQRVLEKDPGNLEARCLSGFLALKKGDADTAAEDFRFVVERAPDDYRAFYGLGLCEERGGHLLAAVEALRTAADLNPEFEEVREALDRCTAQSDTSKSPHQGRPTSNPFDALVERIEAAGSDSVRRVRSAFGGVHSAESEPAREAAAAQRSEEGTRAGYLFRPAGTFVQRGRLGELPAGAGVEEHAAPAPRPGPVDAAVPRRFRRGRRGTVRDLTLRQTARSRWYRQNDTIQEEVLSFRLEVHDREGNVVERVPVELRSREIHGLVLRDGDEVVVLGHKPRHGYIRPSAIYVLNSGSIIREAGVRWGRWLLIIVVVVVLLLIWQS